MIKPITGIHSLIFEFINVYTRLTQQLEEYSQIEALVPVTDVIQYGVAYCVMRNLAVLHLGTTESKARGGPTLLCLTTVR